MRTLFLSLAIALASPALAFDLVPQTGHTDTVQGFAFSPDGKLAASVGSDSAMRVWHVATGKEIAHASPAKSGVTFTQDGKHIVYPTPDALVFWEIASRKVVQSFPLNGANITHVAADRSGRMFALGCPQWQRVYVFDLVARKPVMEFNPHDDERRPFVLAFSAGGTRLASYGQSYKAQPAGQLTVWDVATGKRLRSFTHRGDGAGLAFKDDDTLFVHTSNELSETFNVRISTGAKEEVKPSNNSCSSVSADATYLTSGNDNGTRIIELSTGKAVATLAFKACMVRFNKDNTLLAALRGNQTTVHALPSGALLDTLGGRVAEIGFGQRSPSGLRIGGAGGGIYFAASTVVFDTTTLKAIGGVSGSLLSVVDDEHALVKRGENTIALVHIRSGNVLFEKPGKEGAGAGDTIAIQVDKDAVHIYGRDGVEKTQVASGYEAGSLVVSDDGRYVAGTTRNFVWVWDVLAKKRLVGESASFYNSTPALSASLIALAHDDGVTLWRLNDGKVHAKFPLGKLSSVAFSPDGLRLAATCGNGTCTKATTHMLDVSTGKTILSLDAPGQFGASLAFSPDGKMLAYFWTTVGVFKGDGRLVRIPSGEKVRDLTGHSNWATGAFFSADGKRLFSTSRDGTIRIRSTSTNAEASLVGSDDQWILYDNKGTFDASARGGQLVAMVDGDEPYGVDQFALRDNRPDLLFAALHFDAEQIEHFKKQWQRRLRKAGISESALSKGLHVPTATLLDAKVEPKSVALRFRCSDAHSPLQRYHVYVNDVPVLGSAGKPVSGAQADLSETVAITAGRNKIEVSCMNAAGAESFRALTYADGPKAQGDLYYLGFGVSKYAKPELSLAYADKDAKNLGELFSLSKGFDKVHTKVVVNQQVTPAAINDAKKFLADAKVDDTVVLFIAGHGMHARDGDNAYYYLTHNADPEKLSETAASFESIEALLQDVLARRKLFLMDTCESGELEDGVEVATASLGSRGIKGRGITQKKKTAAAPAPKRPYLRDRDRYVYNDLARRSGAIVFSSSRGGELSYESTALQNGLFTETLLEALTQDVADRDKDGIISTDELRDYVSAAVPKLSNDMQNPTVDRDNLEQKFGFPIVPAKIR